MNAPLRRGTCPGLSAPMQTGDGLLVRLRPTGVIPLDAFARLCAAAREHGNGVIEVTARGGIQVRGLRPASASQFADAVARLEIAVADGIPVLINPLAGIASAEIADVRSVATDLRDQLARRRLAARLGAKISVAVDGGGPLNLDLLTADVRLRAVGRSAGAALQVSVGGDAVSAAMVGLVAIENGADAAMRLLDILAQRGRRARACEIVDAEGSAAFRSAVADLLIGEASPCAPAPRGEVLGNHRLLDRSLARGVGLAFGHADVSALQRLTEAADAVGAKGLVVAPDRAFVAVGVSSDAADEFAAAAERLGFIVRSGDPRRHVIACAGAPFCASAHFAARTFAPSIAKIGALFLDGSVTIHVSGCAKGCAHPAPAALTIVGTPEGCALVANGTARDAPFAAIPVERLAPELARAIGELHHV
jgi:precorrin-3B synthase